jgi:hypothetical protein
MNRQTSAVAVLLLSSTLLASCSGAPGNRCIEACRGGNAEISFVLTATPPDPALGLSIQAFTANITGLTLTPSSGAAVNVPLNSSPYVAEFNRVTSDSTPLASKVSVPVGTYTEITVAFSAPRVTFCTQATPGVPGCVSGTLRSLSGAAGTATISTNLTVTDSLESGVALNVSLPSALTLSGQSVTAVNLAAANVFTAAALPPSATKTDLASAELSHVDDVMGLITSANGSTLALTIQTATRGSITATANSSTQFSTDCTTLGFSQDFTCVKANAAAVVDTLLNADGTFTLVFYQPLPTPLSSGDLIEGVVTGVPNSVTNQFTVVVTDSVFASSGSLLQGRVNLGDQIQVTLSTPNPFTIVAKGLTFPAGSAFEHSTSVASILPGQTVAISVSAFTAQSGGTPGTASSENLALRFTRFTAVIGAATLPLFNATNFPAFFGLATGQQFQTTSGRLSLDGVSNLTSISDFRGAIGARTLRKRPRGMNVEVVSASLGTRACPAYAIQIGRTMPTALFRACSKHSLSRNDYHRRENQPI